ncbi:protein of unknown function DUF752 [Methanocaldococcus infernus ME]|uniref:MnmC-like methyltransferase domain-containing protein n=2 Tax=Methanocaldococcus infernus TaxID=67760 RepID=D5VQQ4_METIM|nr:protein of unknown function DUF752 [Methanocaldococcus infernus ME]
MVKIMLPQREALKVIRKYIPIYDGDNEEKLKVRILEEIKKFLVKTEDGTFTLKAEDENEKMHSSMGSLKEAIYKFVKPTELEYKKKPFILDLCSGLTYNAVSALHFNKDAKIHMVEICEEVLFLSLFLEIPFKEHEIVKDKIREYFLNKLGYSYKSKYKNIILDVADARKINLYNYDIIFHDAFSPKRDPTLYTYNFLKKLYSHLNKEGVLVSYSSSIPFRRALVESNYIIVERKSPERKRGITLAYKEKSTEERINEVDERLIALSINSIPYIDKNLSWSREKIKEYREKIKREIKNELIKKNIYIPTKKIRAGKVSEKILKIQKERGNSTEIIKRMSEVIGWDSILRKYLN